MKGIKTGGRQKGTPNKATAMTKGVISTLLADYSDSGMMRDDFLALDPKDRMVVAEKLIQYVIPKMQASSVDMNVQGGQTTLEETLKRLSEQE